jgi:catechol-2,3-dioxygenase
MTIRGLNHAVLYVRDAERSAGFYTDVLGFRRLRTLPGAVFLLAPGSTNDHDLGLFGIGAAAFDSAAGNGAVGLYHLSWEVETLADLADHRDRLIRAGALAGASDHGTTKALYAKDPDGLEFELSWIVPHRLLTGAEKMATLPLDLDAEIAHYGPDTLGRARGDVVPS